jgi:hypothetical protein
MRLFTKITLTVNRPGNRDADWPAANSLSASIDTT